MARELQVPCPGAMYPVWNRGDRREPIVCDDEDRARVVSGRRAVSPAMADASGGVARELACRVGIAGIGGGEGRTIACGGEAAPGLDVCTWGRGGT